MKSQRKQVVVNPTQQYRSAIVMAALLFVSINIFLFAGAFFPLQTGLYINFSMQQLLIVILLELLIILAGWWLNIRATHKIYGPVYAFGRELEKLAEGNLCGHVNLRESDAHKDVAEKINISLINFRLRIKRLKDIAQQMEANQDVANQRLLIEKLNTELNKITTDEIQE